MTMAVRMRLIVFLIGAAVGDAVFFNRDCADLYQNFGVRASGVYAGKQ